MSTDNEHLWIRDLRRHPEGEVRLYVDGRLVSGTFAGQVVASIDAPDKPRLVSFTASEGWPTPNHCRRAADALDALTSAQYGEILRAYANAEERRFDRFGSLYAAPAPRPSTDPTGETP